MIMNVIMWLTLICSTTQMGGSMEIPNEIINAFNYGDASSLSAYLFDDVSLKIVDQDSRDKKMVTIEKLNKFFKNVNVSSFKLKHSGLRDDFFFKRVNGHIYIHQIRIDNAKD